MILDLGIFTGREFLADLERPEEIKGGGGQITYKPGGGKAGRSR